MRKTYLWNALAAIVLLTLAGCGGGGGDSSSDPNYTHQQAIYSQATSLRALVYLPDGYDADTTKRWPLIIYLHGMDQQGTDLDQLILGTGIPARIEQGFNPPFIVISPQCPVSTTWDRPLMINNLYNFINEVTTLYRIDPGKINLTGFSMGGEGTWALGIAHPELFAALAPVGSGTRYQNVAVLKDKPIWVFHGQDDTVCPRALDDAMVADLRKAGSTTVKLTIWPGADHGRSCTETYLDQELYDWFVR